MIADKRVAAISLYETGRVIDMSLCLLAAQNFKAKR